QIAPAAPVFVRISGEILGPIADHEVVGSARIGGGRYSIGSNSGVWCVVIIDGREVAYITVVEVERTAAGVLPENVSCPSSAPWLRTVYSHGVVVGCNRDGGAESGFAVRVRLRIRILVGAVKNPRAVH